MKLHRYCQPCDTYTHVSKPACKVCGQAFPEKEKVAKSVDESVLTLSDPYTRQCSDPACGALTRGNRCVDCRVCGKPLRRKEKKIVEKEKSEPKARVYTAQEIEAAKAKKQCECGAWTPGYRTLRCHACGAEFPRRSREKIEVEQPEVVTEIEDRFKPELEFKSETWEYPARYRFPSFMRKEDVSFCEYPCPALLKYDGEFPQDHEVIEWAHEVRERLINIRYVYPNNAALFGYIREQFKGKFADQSDEMLYLRELIFGLPDRKRKKKVEAA